MSDLDGWDRGARELAAREPLTRHLVARDLLAGRLAVARRGAFVGRAEQLAAFRVALAGAPEAPAVRFLHGPGGVGKSMLMRRFADEARDAGRRVVLVDGGRITPSPAGFEAAAAGAQGFEPVVLLVDAFERCQGLAGWLRDRFLPRLPLDSVVVLAGRLPPDPVWTLDPAWAQVLRVEALGDLPAAEAVALLRARGVPDSRAEPVLAFAGGHPLALSLAAASAVDLPFEPPTDGAGPAWEPTREVVTVLLDQLVGDVPSASRRLALEMCALVPSTTEGLLRVVVGDRAPEVFAWLRDLPFVNSGRDGVSPHRLVRSVLTEDLRWRDPQALEDLHDRATGHLVERVRTAPPEAADRALHSLHHLLRPGIGLLPGPDGFHGVEPTAAGAGFLTDGLRGSDRAFVVRTAVGDGGPAAAAAIGHWLERRPESFRIVRRSASGEAVAFVASIELGATGADEAAAEPVAAAAWARTRGAPLRAGESLLLNWFGGPPEGQCPPAVAGLMESVAIAGWLTADRPAWSVVALPASAGRSPLVMEQLGHAPAGPPVLVGGSGPTGVIGYRLFEHDWRTVPVADWLHGVGRRSRSGPAPAAAPEVAVLTRPEFDAAVRAALRGWPELTGNPLLRGRLVSAAGSGGREEALRTLIAGAVEAIGEDPREAKFHRAVATTYLDRRISQEAAAERLGLPFSTYRRHLNRGLQRICDQLWRLEL